MTSRIPISSQIMSIRVMLERNAVTKIGARSQEADRLKQFLEATLDTLIWLDANRELIKAFKAELGGEQ